MQRRKNSATHYQRLYTPQDGASAFIDHEPQMLFGVVEPGDCVTLQLIAEQNERRRIAQELHDTLLQGFTCVALRLDALTSSLPPALSKTKEQLLKILEQIDEYLAEARRTVWKLRSSSLESAGDFSSALVKASARALDGTGIQSSFSVHGAARRIRNAVEDNLLRICEEAVANAAKHALPTQVEVTLAFNSEAVELSIRDNGCGFDPAASDASKMGHFGLLGIKERVEAISGALSIESLPGRGTSVQVTIPTRGRRNAETLGRITGDCHENCLNSSEIRPSLAA